MNILKIYGEATGQEINMAKSEVFFSRNLSQAAQADLSRIMGVRHVLGTGTYLGLPSMVVRSKKATFAYIKDRMWKRINSWRGRAMSKAGKEVMIKSVLQAIPSYVMSIYLIPETTIKEIERMMNAFWWGGGSNDRGIRWLAWDRMTYPKELGGLGFRDLQLFNMAMVAKQGWKLMKNTDTLVARLFEARWKIGDGTRIKVMSDPWLRKEDGLWMNSPQDQGQEGWKHLWKVQAPPKTKHLLWRVCKDCLPTRERLHERIAAWQNAGLYSCLQQRLQRCSTVKEVLFDICCHEEKEMAGKIAMLM
ncbi:ribonuclease H [Trifolium pratense]|uniref:Ribonuclease H n=1 Tax=Trifolium pratense TaxID=57577 RepID=A0A2K3LID6_TRIPR|nr:ribonuclease H [Trifolium pratense]